MAGGGHGGGGWINRKTRDLGVPTPVPGERSNFSFCSSEMERSGSKTNQAAPLSPSQPSSGNLRSLLILDQRMREGAPVPDMTPSGPRKETVDVQ